MGPDLICRGEHRDFTIVVQEHWKPDDIGPRGVFVSIGHSVSWQHASGAPTLQARGLFPAPEAAYQFAVRQIDAKKMPR
jgi:hypothetical protein